MNIAQRIVMVVDDNEGLRESICELLEDEGYRTLSMGGGASALTRLRTGDEKPDLILLDLMMPGMNGWDFREEQARDPSLASIPVVVMTASRELQGIRAAEIVYKPVKRDKLLAVVEKHSGGKPRESARSSPPTTLETRHEGSRAVDEAPKRIHQTPPNDVLRGGGAMGALMRTMDWANSPLGPIESWSTSLRTLVSAVLQNRFPMHLWWTQDLVVIYNDAYQPMLGDKHPHSMGAFARDVWAEIWDVLGPQAQSVLNGGPATWNEHLLLFLQRKGFLEETYWTFSYSPARDDCGSVGGILVTVQETTEQVQGERQLEMLRDLGAQTGEGKSIEEACRAATSVLANYNADIPFVLLYVFRSDGAEAELVATAGTHDDPQSNERHHFRPSLHDWPIDEVRGKSQPFVVRDLEKRFDALPTGSWKKAPTQAVILSLVATGQSQPQGYLVAGVSPVRALDERYTRMYRLVADQVVTMLSAARAFRLELGRLRNEAREQRERLYSLFMQAPIPICVFRGTDLVFEMANPLCLKVAGLSNVLGRTFSDAIPEARGQGFDDLLRGVMTSGESYIGKETPLRLDRDHDGITEDSYFSFICAPIRNEAGVIDRVMTVIHDVTDQVSARQRIEESEEKFRRIVTQVQAGIAQTDLDGHFTLANDRFREIVGRSETELAQLRMQDITHPDDLSRNWQLFQKLLEQGTPFVIEKRYVRPEGSIVWVQNSVSRIDDREGRPQGTVAVSIDITRRKFAEQALIENEERYRTLVEQVIDYAIFRTDPQGRASTWNEGVKRVLGFDEHEFVGLDITEMIFTPEDVRAGIPQRELETAAKEGTASNDRWMQRKNGTRFFAAGVTSALRADDGALIGFTKVMRDQTEKLHAEEAAAHLAAIVTSSDDAIISTDLQGIIRSWNKGSERLYGYLAEEVIGKPAALLIPADRVDEEPGIMARIARGEVVDHYETVRQRKDGTLVDISLTASPIKDSRGRIIGEAKITRDISEQKRSAREREARVAEMEQTLNFSERFVGILGHDLRNPLGAIIMASDLLLRRETGERITRPIQRIRTSAERMSRMIEQILDLTRARIGGGIPVEPNSIDLEELAKTLVEELEGAAPRSIVRESVGDTKGDWDGDRLAQVISNLLGNAIEHGDESEPVRLTLDGSDPKFVRFSVWNAGLIPEDLLPTLFNPFRGAPPTAKTHRSKGLGLGLYIVQQVVEAHQGVIDVRSTASEGTTFSVSIPRHSSRKVDATRR